jgi:putative FmdB family regulatory protein
MPTYEYACIDCGTHVEVFQRISEDSLTTCGACGGRLRKVFHPAGILFKGSGFYRTDSRSSKASPDGGSGGDTKKASPGSSEKKSGDPAKGKSA